MSDDTYPQPDGEVASVEPEQLAAWLRAGDQVSVLDVRNRAEMEAWPLSGPSVTTHHVPYYRFVEAEVTDGLDDLAADVADALDAPILVICGRGEASAYVAEHLAERGVDAANLADGMRGWARVYEAVELAVDGFDTVLQYQRPSSGCLAYLVVDGDEAAVVDPLRMFADRYVDDAREFGADLVYAVDTHVHADHVSGVRDVASVADATTVLPSGATARGLAFDARLVDDGERLDLGGGELAFHALPGHTSEMLGVGVGDLLVAGDTVFLESVARPDLERGDEGAADAAETLHETIEVRLREFPPATRLAPGHFSEGATPDADGAYVATLGDLFERLPALSLSREAFVEYAVDDMPPRPANYEEIIEINLGREAADDEEAFELELGPNNCAATGGAAAD